MNLRERGRSCALAAAVSTLLVSAAWAATADAAPAAATAAPARDGQRDFDYLLGSWKIHLKRLVHPLTGSNEWVEFDGTTVCRHLWGGRAEVEEFNVDSPKENLHIQGLALRLYNPASRQWSIYWANAAKGVMDIPPMVGQFTGDHGEFYDQESYEGRAVYVRFLWTRVNTSSPHFEQAYSTDGGKTWETNWITDQTKVSP
jgi:hypothetical protein